MSCMSAPQESMFTSVYQILPTCPLSTLHFELLFKCRLSSKIGFALRFYSVFENEQLKVKVFQIQYSDFVHFYLKNRKLKIFEQCNEARTPFLAATSPPPPLA